MAYFADNTNNLLVGLRWRLRHSASSIAHRVELFPLACDLIVRPLKQRTPSLQDGSRIAEVSSVEDEKRQVVVFGLIGIVIK